MKPVKTIMIRNGDFLMPYRIYTCEKCGKELKEAWPIHFEEDGAYCGDCAFIDGLIDEEEYLNGFLFFIQLPGMRAAVHDGKIYVEDHNRKFPWEMTDKQQRKTQEYADWRTKVFQRDGFKCQICGQVGGELNAHHIKSFAKHVDLRFDIDNGVTLCKECHKRVHKEGTEEWIK